MDKTELRLDPLTRDWTIFNESRAFPPTTKSVRDDVLAESPFRAGLESFAAHALHHSAGESGWQVRVVPNRLPVLRVEGDSQPQADGLYEHLDAVGANEIVIEDPGSRMLEELPPGAIAQVIRAWAVRIEDLMRDHPIAVVYRGEKCGPRRRSDRRAQPQPDRRHGGGAAFPAPRDPPCGGAFHAPETFAVCGHHRARAPQREPRGA